VAHVQLEKCFSEDAVSRSASQVWDLIKKCVVSAAEDTMVWALCADWDLLDDEVEFPETDTSEFELDILAVRERKPPARKSAKRATDPNDADLVSTFKQLRENTPLEVPTRN
jgi:hypothetical protein